MPSFPPLGAFWTTTDFALPSGSSGERHQHPTSVFPPCAQCPPRISCRRPVYCPSISYQSTLACAPVRHNRTSSAILGNPRQSRLRTDCA
ncbi:hypothetical protein C2S51_020086 [Perilla frutescens var. frutescens]|nr:hypothetical protein C2S51_020086 [Perilla frutescens var. frutescens]